MKTHKLLVVITLFFISGCSIVKFPSVHTVPIQQGNIVEQDMIDKLRPGMSKSQAQFVLGTPMLVDTFNKNRWIYFYSFSDANSVKTEKELTLYFDENGELERLTGDYSATEPDIGKQ
mgnify:CR=1 FL=1